jgi:hypothetical protein
LLFFWAPRRAAEWDVWNVYTNDLPSGSETDNKTGRIVCAGAS